MDELQTYKTILSFLINNHLKIIFFVISLSLFLICLKLLLKRREVKFLKRSSFYFLSSILSIFLLISIFYTLVPLFSIYYLFKGNSYISQNNIISAYKNYKKAYYLSPSDPGIISCLAYSSYYSNRFDESYSLLSRLYNSGKITPDLSILYSSLLLNSENMELAKKNLDFAVKYVHDPTMAEFYLGKYYELENNLNKAEEHYLKALKGNKNFRQFILKNLLKFYEKTGELKKSQEILHEIKKDR